MKRLSLFTQRVDEVVFFDRSGRYFMGRCGSLLWCLTAHVAFMLFREWIMELHFFLPCFKSLTSKYSYPSLCVVKRKQKKTDLRVTIPIISSTKIIHVPVTRQDIKRATWTQSKKTYKIFSVILQDYTFITHLSIFQIRKQSSL